jgi:hypothetical protein
LTQRIAADKISPTSKITIINLFEGESVIMAEKNRKYVLLAVLSIFVVLFFNITTCADAGEKPSAPAKPAEGGGGDGGSGAAKPDLFTGTMSYSVPLEVAPGRKGMQPNLALTYRSGNGNGWLGVGWELEVGAIERSALTGVNYTGDDYVLRAAGSAIALVKIGSNEFGQAVTDEYRAKMESGFMRIRKLSAGWEVTDKSGTVYSYGATAASRQDNSGDTTQIFKWCLNKVTDTNGNYMTLGYTKDNGQIYLDRIDYTGNGALATTNYVKFYLESRADAPDMYSTNFKVKTAYRLKTIDVSANGNRVRAYKLTYQSSSSTMRSVLTSIQQFGKDASFDSSWTITGEARCRQLPWAGRTVRA